VKKEHREFIEHTLELARKAKADGKHLRTVAFFLPRTGKPAALPLNTDTEPMQQMSLRLTRETARTLKSEAVIVAYEGYHKRTSGTEEQECILMLYVSITGEKALYKQAFRKQGHQILFDDPIVMSGSDITGNIADLFDDKAFEDMPPDGTC
jgi:hypothetical protein